MDDAKFKAIISELENVELALAARVGTGPERTRLASIRASLETAVRMGQLERVVDALLPAAVPPPAGVWHASRSAAARLDLVAEHGAWTSAELADRAGSKATNRSALASAWRAAGRVLAVEWNGATVFPTFQFGADCQPLTVIADILEHLRAAGLSEWQQALWFNERTGWLGDRRPVDLLDGEPSTVVDAAAAFTERPT